MVSLLGVSLEIKLRDYRFLEEPPSNKREHLQQAQHPNQLEMPLSLVRHKINYLAGQKPVHRQVAFLERHRVLVRKNLLEI